MVGSHVDMAVKHLLSLVYVTVSQHQRMTCHDSVITILCYLQLFLIM